jgi:hypothetical protein
MSTYIHAEIEKDKMFAAHKQILIACKKAKVSLPKETAEYFGSTDPDWDLLNEKLEFELVERKHYSLIDNNFPECGFILHIKKLPKEVCKVYFNNSW